VSEAARAPSVAAVLAGHARERGDHVYLETIDPPRRLTFGQLDALTRRLGRLLAARGVRAEDRVSVLAENSLGFVVLFLGIQRYGAAVNPINVEVNAKNVAHILGDVKPRLVFVSRGLPAELDEAVAASGAEAVDFDPDDVEGLLADVPAAPEPGAPGRFAVIDYTSGSTARPKGVCISHDAFSYMCDSVRRRFGIEAGEAVLEYRSLAWASPQLLSVGAALHSGARLVLARRFSQRRFFDWIRNYGITIAVGVPTVINMLLDRPVAVTAAELPALKFITSSSAPLPVERHRAFEARYGIPIVQGCGMTEAGWMAGNPPGARRMGSIGLPMPHLRVWFADAAGAPCPPGVEGELTVGGVQMASAYLAEGGRLEPIPADAFATGDLGYADEDGYLHLTGRKKDLIIKGGVNIAPLEITTALLSHPAVADAATIGVADATYGEAILSFVVPRAGAAVSADALLAHCRGRLAPFKMPAQVVLLDAIPRTERGKVARDTLQALWRSHRGH
jgi:acyl-coenzyme A synthetase/AMP-(fatty) acid ligase